MKTIGAIPKEEDVKEVVDLKEIQELPKPTYYPPQEKPTRKVVQVKKKK